MTVFPRQIRSLAKPAGHGYGQASARRTDWLLDIAGPFCLYPHSWAKKRTTYYRRGESLTNTLSRHFALECRYRIVQGAIYLEVVLIREDMERFIREEYSRATATKC